MQNLDPRMDVYADFLLVAGKEATAVRLSKILGEKLWSHDKFSRMLNGEEYDSRKLWSVVKSSVRRNENDNGVLIIDDTIVEKACTDKNEINCYHFDHSKGRHIRGINILNMVVDYGDIFIPVAYDIVHKYDCCDIKTQKEKSVSPVTKNELFRKMLDVCINNSLKFNYVLGDIWFSSAENMAYIKEKHKKDFIFGIKGNRNVSSKENHSDLQRLDSLLQKNDIPTQVYIESIPFPVLVLRHEFINEDGSKAVMHLVSSDLALSAEKILDLYKRRWKIEEFHKSLKSNASIGNSPTHTPKTQSNHIFAAMLAFTKIQIMAKNSATNPFSIARSLFVAAARAAFNELQILKAKTNLIESFA
jgi:Transposase DDE domain